MNHQMGRLTAKWCKSQNSTGTTIEMTYTIWLLKHLVILFTGIKLYAFCWQGITRTYTICQNRRFLNSEHENDKSPIF